MFRRVLNFFKGARAAGGQAEAGQAFKIKYSNFKEVLDSNSELLQLITEMEEKLRGDVVFGLSFVRSQSSRLVFHAERMVRGYDQLSGRRYPILKKVMSGLRERINAVTERKREHASCGDIRQYAEISKDMVDCVGGKNANLGEIKSKAKLPIPSGFAITTDAFRAFIEANECMDEIRRFKLELDPNDTETIVRASEDIQRLFIMAQVPEALSAEIEAAYEAMCREAGRDEVPVALRSSAIGEDSELSFAGQYLTVLNVPRSKILDAYKQVLASLFTPRALSYRLHQGVPVDDIAMSVACLEMVSSKASGVMYTRHPFRLLEDNIMVNAVWGLGAYAVDGVVTPDVYVFSKDDPPRLLRRDISTKNVRLVDKAGGVVEEEAVEPALQQRPCLTDEQAQVLAGYGLALERHFGSPQDIEWALDAEDRLILLQARPLRTEPGAAEAGQDDLDLVPGYEVVLKGQGVAYPGVGFGRVFHVRQDQDLTRFPEGAVLVAEHASPKYGLVLPKAKALLTDSGSVTGHMASLAREYRVPSILNTATASRDLRQDEEITVDAYSGRVYRGRVEELARLVQERGALMKGTPVYDTLRELADLVVPLNLMDPKSEAFTPANCKTVHDLMRLIHEFCYTEMFAISDVVSDQGEVARKLVAPIPLDLYVIDLGGGVRDAAAAGRKVNQDQVVSAPFRALLNGMLHKGLRSMEPRPVDLKGFFSVVSQQMLSKPDMAGERFGDKSYAIISDKYLNFSSRVGYHYSILDAYCGLRVNNNYIQFQFKGGAANDLRRNRRARAIALMLEELGFEVQVTGDRVVARIQKYEQEVLQQRLESLGRLLQFTRQMDMLMVNEASVEAVAKCFREENYHFDPGAM